MHEHVASLKGAIEQSAGKTFGTLKAVAFQSQIVNGVNYKVKVVGDDSVNLLVKFYWHPQKPIQLSEVSNL